MLFDQNIRMISEDLVTLKSGVNNCQKISFDITGISYILK